MSNEISCMRIEAGCVTVDWADGTMQAFDNTDQVKVALDIRLRLADGQPDPPTLAQIKAKFPEHTDGVGNMYYNGCFVLPALDAAYEAEWKQLEAWKASAMSVMDPLQDIAKEFDLPLGKSIPAEMAELIRSQAVSIAELRTTLDRSERLTAEVRRQLDGAGAEIERLRKPPAPQPVKTVASPSISARWSDGPGMVKV